MLYQQQIHASFRACPEISTRAAVARPLPCPQVKHCSCARAGVQGHTGRQHAYRSQNSRRKLHLLGWTALMTGLEEIGRRRPQPQLRSNCHWAHWHVVAQLSKAELWSQQVAVQIGKLIGSAQPRCLQLQLQPVLCLRLYDMRPSF